MFRSCLDRAALGVGSFVVVRGEAGIGKSHLLRCLERDAAERGWPVVSGRADEVERDAPFGALLDAAARMPRPELVGVVDAIRERALVPTDRTPLVIDALLDALDQLVAINDAAVVVFDDVQWADPGVVSVLRRLSPVTGVSPVVVVISTRPTPRRDLDIALDDVAADGARLIELGGLDDDAVNELAAWSIGASVEERDRGFLRGCAGNPFYVLEIAGVIRPDARNATAPRTTAPGAASRIPPSARLAVLRRLGFLPSDVVHVLRLASLLGTTFSLHDLATIDGRASHQLLEMLSEARISGLIVESGTRLAFRHDLVREALYDDLPGAARSALHRSAAEALRVAHAPVAVVARQYAAGSEPGDRQAVAALRSAATDALRSSIASGIDLLEHALRLCRPGDRIRDEVIAELLEPLTWAGRHDDAAKLAGESLGRSLPLDLEAGVRDGLAGTFAARGDTARALDTVIPLFDRDDLDAVVLARLHASTAILYGIALDAAATCRHASAAEQLVEQHGDAYAGGIAATARAFAARTAGDPAEARRHANRAEAYARRESIPPWGRFNPDFTSALIDLDTDDLDSAARHVTRGRATTDEGGSTTWSLSLLGINMLLSYLRGDFDMTVHESMTALRHGGEHGSGLAGSAHALIARVAMHNGDHDTAARHTKLAEEVFAATGPAIGIDLSWWMTALQSIAEGRADEAFELLKLAWQLTTPARHLLSFRLLAPELVALAATRDPALAQSITDEIVSAQNKNPAPSVQGAALLCRGLADSDHPALLACIEPYQRSGRRTEHAAALAKVALALPAKHPQRRDLLGQAIAAAAALGAIGDVATLERATGRQAANPPRRPTSGWDALTRTELEVVHLLLGGRTNRSIGEQLGISRRTVETHLSHVFSKLGLSTRVELAVEVARRNARPDN